MTKVKKQGISGAKREMKDSDEKHDQAYKEFAQALSALPTNNKYVK